MMNSALLITASFLLGVDYKVEQVNGENTFVLEIEESIAEQLTEGFEITSSVPAEYAHVNKIRISIVKDTKNDDEFLKTDQEAALPSLEPDSTIVPQQPNTSINTKFQLEPSALALPDLTPRHHAIEATISGPLLVPEFDATKEGDDQLDSRELGLLVPQEPVVSIPDEKPESPEVPIETLVRGEPPVHAPARTVPADASGGATKPTLDEPNQILAADDTFISLATHDDDGEPKDANGGSLQLETDSNSTSLLFLLFSVTLNLFLGAQVFRHYRN